MSSPCPSAQPAASPRLPVRGLAGSLALLLAACPGDDATGDPEATAGVTDTGGSTTGGGPGPDGTTADTTTADATSGSTTAVVDDTGTTTGGALPRGTCVGLERVGHLGMVLSRDAAPVETSCDPTPVSCGGDPVGSWALESLCGVEATPNPFADECPGSTFELEILAQTGTLTLEEDGALVQDFDIETLVVLTLDPMECFGLTCAELEVILQMQEATPTATCDDMGPNCECTFPDDGQPEQVTGTWEVMGNDLLVTTEDVTVTLPFCIAGDRHALWQPLHDAPVTTAVHCDTQRDCIDALGDMYDLYVCSLGDA